MKKKENEQPIEDSTTQEPITDAATEATNTEEQVAPDELEEMKTSFYTKVKSKRSQNLSASDKTELVQLYSNHKKKWNSKINLFSKKYNTEPKFIVNIFNRGESKMNCKH